MLAVTTPAYLSPPRARFAFFSRMDTCIERVRGSEKERKRERKREREIYILSNGAGCRVKLTHALTPNYPAANIPG